MKEPTSYPTTTEADARYREGLTTLIEGLQAELASLREHVRRQPEEFVSELVSIAMRLADTAVEALGQVRRLEFGLDPGERLLEYCPGCGVAPDDLTELCAKCNACDRCAPRDPAGAEIETERCTRCAAELS